MSEFNIPITQLDDEAKEFSFAVRVEWLNEVLADTDLRSDGAVGSLELQAQKNGPEVLLTGRLQAGLVGRCVRCLEDAAIAVSTDVTCLLVPQGAEGDGHGEELSAEDLDRATYEGDSLVLDAMVRENLVLECPMQPVCRDDCKGLQVPAHIRPPEDFGGTEQGVDPRLSPLLKLKDKVLPKKE